MDSYRPKPGQTAVRVMVFLLLLSGAILASSPGRAAGALAVALPQDVTKDGFSSGWATNEASADQADAHALEYCRTSKDALNSVTLRSLCKVVQDFTNQCVAVSLDPAAGTPGVGWAVAVDSATAQSTAVANCKQTAGPDRQDFCKFACDGSAQ